MPKAAGSRPATSEMSGCASLPPLSTGWPGGTNGVRLAPVTNQAPATMVKTQMATLTTTRRPVTFVTVPKPRTGGPLPEEPGGRSR